MMLHRWWCFIDEQMNFSEKLKTEKDFQVLGKVVNLA